MRVGRTDLLVGAFVDVLDGPGDKLVEAQAQNCAILKRKGEVVHAGTCGQRRAVILLLGRGRTIGQGGESAFTQREKTGKKVEVRSGVALHFKGGLTGMTPRPLSQSLAICHSSPAMVMRCFRLGSPGERGGGGDRGSGGVGGGNHRRASPTQWRPTQPIQFLEDPAKPSAPLFAAVRARMARGVGGGSYGTGGGKRPSVYRHHGNLLRYKSRFEIAHVWHTAQHTRWSPGGKRPLTTNMQSHATAAPAVRGLRQDHDTRRGPPVGW